MSDKINMKDLVQNEDEQKYQNIVNQNANQPNDMIALMAITELLNPKKLKTISRVKMDQVAILSKLYLYADVFKQPFTKQLGDLILQIQISVNGLGRKDLVQVGQPRLEMMEQPKPNAPKDIFR